MELNQKEIACVAHHLMAQHRQTVFNRRASILEACEKCPYFTQCKDSNFEQWKDVYTKLCKSVEVKGNFSINSYPLEPYEKEDVLVRF